MNISILAVGTELLMGKTLNTNATYLSKEINNLGHSVMYHMTVGDNPQRLKETLKYLLNISDMVITTGGLGPTKDDLTKEIIAETINEKLVFDADSLERMKERFKVYNVEMTENNKKQAYMPENSIIMVNDKGTAPGFISTFNNKFVAALPGPPHEMQGMFEKSLKTFLEEKSEGVIVSEYINLFGIGESSAASVIDKVIEEQNKATIAIYANVGVVSIRVTTMSYDEKSGKEIIKPVVEKISKLLEKYVVSYGEVELIDVTMDLIKKKKLNLSLAESCTGGLVSASFIAKSGASEFFNRAFVTYTNKSKEELLNVSSDTLKEYGAVSEETCKEMVEGLYNVTKSDICVSITGIAGPLGGTEEKPVGLVYIGVSIKGKVSVKKYNFLGDRDTIRKRALLNSINDIRKGIMLL